MPDLSKTVGPMKPSTWTRSVNSAVPSLRGSRNRFSSKWSKSFTFGGNQRHLTATQVGGEWTQKEFEEHIPWIRTHLKDDRIKTFQDLKLAMSDGMSAVRLLENMSKERVPGVSGNPLTRSERQKNLQACIDFIKKGGGITNNLSGHELQKLGTSEDLLAGDTRALLIFVRNMRLLYDKGYPHNLNGDSRNYRPPSNQPRVQNPAISTNRVRKHEHDYNIGVPGVLQPSPNLSQKKPKKISETQLNPDGVSQLVISETRTSSFASSSLTTFQSDLQHRNEKDVNRNNIVKPQIERVPEVPPRPKKKPPPPPPLPQRCDHKSERSFSETHIISGSSGDSPRKSVSYSTGIGKSSNEFMFRSVTPVSIGDHPSDSNSAATVISATEASHKRPQATRQVSSPRLIEAGARAGASNARSHSPSHLKNQTSSSASARAFTESNVPYSRHSRRFYENPSFQTETSTASASAHATATGLTAAASASATASASVTRTYESAVWDLSGSRTPREKTEVARAPEAALAMMPPGAVMSIASQLSSDVYTDETDEPARNALNYSVENLRESLDPINRPDPAMGHYHDSMVSLDSSVDAPPDLLPSPTIRARLRVLLDKEKGHEESEASSDADVYGSAAGSEALTDDIDGISSIKHQIAGLENMYKEVLRVLGVDSSLIPSSHQLKALELMKSAGTIQVQPQNHPRRRLRHLGQRNTQEMKMINKRVEKLESHIVTLAQCVSEISSDLHQIRLQNSMRGSARGSSARTGQTSDAADAGSFESPTPPTGIITNIRLCIAEPKRLAKLKWFFGQEPPFLKEFLESLGYEKYVKRFENEQIGPMELCFLTEERLRTLGVPLGPRLRILEEIQNIFRNDHLPTSTRACLV